ncbi:DotG/IcmE/VirB10 family protein [Pseudomonas sp. S1(2024)]|uniref:DotG/IcmE/VirB10 family protein n=1 Tax=Pseudomonas sp. S1(2024) TaxID=3390191 RepID=UPI00397D9857
MGTLANISANITTKARLMIGISIVLVFVIVLSAYLRISSKDEKPTEAVASLESAPTDKEIHKDKASDKLIFDENTEVAKNYQQDNQKRAEEAAKGKDSHVETLRVNVGDVGAAPKIEPKSEPAAPMNLQQLVNERNAQAEIASAKVQTQRAQRAANIQENPWKAFLDEEKKSVTEFEVSFAAKVDEIQTDAMTLAAKPQYDSSQQVPVKSTTANTGTSTADSGYSRYLNPGKFNTSNSVDGAVAQQQPANMDDESTEDEYGDAQVRGSDYPSERIAKASITKQVPVGSISVGQTFYSVLQIGVDTDEISPVRAVTVQKGLLEGAVLTGEPVRTGQKAKIQFSNMSWKGKNYSINAIALDPETYRSGLADSVDNHTFERYSKLAIASFVDGYADALQDTQTVTNTDGSSSTQTNALPDAADQIKMGIGKMGEKFSPIFEREFDRPPTVTVEANKSIIVMFMATVDLAKAK